MATTTTPGLSGVRFALRPRWWAWHLLLVAVLVSFGWLGWWQLQGFQATSAPPAATAGVVGVDEVTSPGGRLGAGDPGRRVSADGVWLAEDQLLVRGRELDGRTGALVVTPLRTEAGLLPVVRGWVPEGSPAPAPPAGRVTVTGVVQPSESEADAAVGAGSVGDGEVAYVATVALLERLPYEADALYDGYVVLRTQQPPDPAAPRLVAADRSADTAGGPGRWRSLAYGLQWWLFAAAAVVFWFAVLRRAARERGAPPAPTGSDPAHAPLAAPRRTT